MVSQRSQLFEGPLKSALQDWWAAVCDTPSVDPSTARMLPCSLSCRLTAGLGQQGPPCELFCPALWYLQKVLQSSRGKIFLKAGAGDE